MDFTPSTYQALLETLKKTGYRFLTFEQYCKLSGEERQKSPFAILRHDVDLVANRSLTIAQIEHALGVQASYYFRVVPQSNQPEIIRAIAKLGHEIGYHYEDLSITNGHIQKAITQFREHLNYFRQYYPVSTICMHGAPTSQYDGRDMWKTYDYHEYDLIGEPYFDMDFNKAIYLTDTGRCWDGYRFSVRDKVPQQEQWIEQGMTFHHTQDIIQYILQCPKEQLPSMMITTHPQRWIASPIGWLKEYFVQNAKNMVKRFIVLRQNK